jgi:3-methyladenine DNA glycosylase AlkD
MHNADLQDQLAAAGAEQYRQTYRRHGVLGDLYGVSYATLTALAKRIKTDHALANSLWESGNHDARVLATRYAMNGAVIGIGNAALRRAATAAARRIGTVRVDHGDTGCTTPDAVAYIDKTWSRKAAR